MIYWIISVAFSTVLPHFVQSNPMLGASLTNFTPRIINGHDSKPGDWPFMVSLMYHGNQHFCGGSILNDNTILTAAHCLLVSNIPAEDTMVYIGHVDINSIDSNSLYEVDRFDHNQQFDGNQLYHGHDVGLVKLKRSIDFTAQKVEKVCLPNPGEEPVAEKCIVMGWGLTAPSGGAVSTILKEVGVPILRSDDCGNGEETLICAGFVQGGKDSCQGDSGGPLVCPMKSDPKQWLQFGIVSYGDGCAKTYGFYTKVESMVKWITERAES